MTTMADEYEMGLLAVDAQNDMQALLDPTVAASEVGLLAIDAQEDVQALLDPTDAAVSQETEFYSFQAQMIEVSDEMNPVPLEISNIPTPDPHDKLRLGSAYPWEHEADKRSPFSSLLFDSNRGVALAALIAAWIFLAAVIGFIFYRLWRQKAEDEESLKSYLDRFESEDVRVYKSPLGGWHVMYKKRLANHVDKYWSGELPSPDETSTIIFEDSSSSERSENESLFPIDILGKKYLDTTTLPDIEDCMSYHSMNSGMTQTASNIDKESRDNQSRGEVISFLGTNFSKEEVKMTSSKNFSSGGIDPTTGMSLLAPHTEPSSPLSSISSRTSNERSGGTRSVSRPSLFENQTETYLGQSEEASDSESDDDNDNEDVGLLSALAERRGKKESSWGATEENCDKRDPEGSMFEV